MGTTKKLRKFRGDSTKVVVMNESLGFKGELNNFKNEIKEELKKELHQVSSEFKEELHQVKVNLKEELRDLNNNLGQLNTNLA